MGWTGYYVNGKINRKNECLDVIEGSYYGKTIKTAMRGTEFYALKEHKGRQYIMVLLTNIHGSEFLYKDIELSPHEQGYIVPPSLLREFKPSTEEDAKWLEAQTAESRRLKEETVKYDIGDILECKADTEVSWSTGHKLAENEKFFVTVEKLNPFKPKSKKVFVITEHEQDYKGEYRWVRRFRRLDKKYFTVLGKVQKEA